MMQTLLLIYHQRLDKLLWLLLVSMSIRFGRCLVNVHVRQNNEVLKVSVQFAVIMVPPDASG